MQFYVYVIVFSVTNFTGIQKKDYEGANKEKKKN